MTEKTKDSNSNGGWLSELTNKRRSQVSNVFLLQTLDPRRIAEVHGASTKFDGLFVQSYVKRLSFNVQTREILDHEGKPADLDSGQGILAELTKILRTEPTILFITNVFERRHAEDLSDFLAACSHDPRLYNHKSTVIVFCTDEYLFPTPLLRLCYTINIETGNTKERRQLLETLKAAISEKYPESKSVKISDDLIQASAGLNLHDLNAAGLESFFKTRQFDVATFTAHKIRILNTAGIQYVEAKRGFDSVGGYEYLKNYVSKRIVTVLRHPEIAAKYGLSIPKGFLLYGPPGTGKSYFVKALSREIGLPMVAISASDFLRGIVGETESRVRQITATIESLSPVVVSIDEFDALTMNREAVMSTDSGVSRRMQNALLEYMSDENRKAFIVGATNFVQQVDPAFLRPGRLDEIIPMFPPDEAARKDILRIHTQVVRSVPLAKGVNFTGIAKDTAMWTGAELEKLVIDATSIGMDSNAATIGMKEFDAAMQARRFNAGQRLKRLETMITQLRQLENVNQIFLDEAEKALKREGTLLDGKQVVV